MWSSLSNPDLLTVQWGAVIGASLAAAVSDIASRRISNKLTLPLFLGGLAMGAVYGGLGGLGESLLAGVLLALPYVLLFVFAGGGAGDAKLMAGIGACLGLFQGTIALAAVAASGIALAIIWSVARGKVRVVFDNIVAMSVATLAVVINRQSAAGILKAGPDEKSAERVPYGVAILAGVVLACMGLLLWRA